MTDSGPEDPTKCSKRPARQAKARLAPLIKMVNAILTNRQMNPLSKKPPRRPTSGTSLHGPVLRNFDRANAADKKEVAKVTTNSVESFPIISVGFCPARHNKICVWGMLSSIGSKEKNLFSFSIDFTLDKE